MTRVAQEERGSIYSTTYRQVQWLKDHNLRSTFEVTNFNLKEFLKGNTDIYIIMPEDQVHEQSRVVRMLFALVTSLLIQTPPKEISQNKILFLLDELGQLGYCPDVEKCIEVLRARNVVVWAVFQALSQIKQYRKADLFIGATMKQIFGCDDPDTMHWIQTVGGKQTILTESVSHNKGDSYQKARLMAGSSSKGEGTSVQETGVDLIKLNDIRELPADEQFVFIHGRRVIKCKKIRYYNEKYFESKYDKNILESRSDKV